MDEVPCVVSKKASWCLSSARLPPSSSSGSLLVLHFTFKSMTHFELIFVKGMRPVSRFTFHRGMSISWGDYLCSIVSPLLLCPVLHFNRSLWLLSVEAAEPLRTEPCPVRSSWSHGTPPRLSQWYWVVIAWTLNSMEGSGDIVESVWA